MNNRSGILALLGGAVLLAGLLWWLLDEDATTRVDATPDDDATPEAHAKEQVGATNGEKKAAKTESKDDAGERRPEAAPRTLLVGRCVDKKTGLPLAGCRVHIGPGGPEMRTGVDGRFELEVTGQKRPFYAVYATRDDRTGIENHLQLPPLQTTDVGDVPLQLATRIQGRVIDRNGHGMPFTPVHFRHETVARRQAGWTPIGWCTATTDHNGDFETTGLVSGKFHVSPHRHNKFTPKSFSIDVSQPLPHLEITVQDYVAEEVIFGRLLAGKAPAPWIKLHLTVTRKRAGKKARMSLHNEPTDEFGRFRFLLKQGNGTEPRIVCTPTAEFLRIDESVKKGEYIELHREPRPAGDVDVTLAVVDDRTGKPVAAAAGYLERVQEQGKMFIRDRRTLEEERFRDGVLELHGLEAGKYNVVITPQRNKKLARGNREIVMPRDRGARLELRLVAQVPLDIQVQDDKGNRTGKSWVVLSSKGWRTNKITDDKGKAQVLRPQKELTVDVQVMSTDGGHFPLMKKGIVIAKDAKSHTLIVARGMRVRGRVTPLDRLRGLNEKARPMLNLSPKKKGGHAATATIGVDGKFVLPSIEPGPHHLRLTVPGKNHAYHTIELPDVTVPADEERPLVIDIASVQFAELRGRAMRDGEPMRNTMLSASFDGGLVPMHLRHTHSRLFVKTDAEGRFVFPHALVGRYRLSAKSWSPWMRLAPGSGEIVFDLSDRTLRLRLFDAAGKPVAAGTKIKTSAGTKTVDQDGCISFTPAPFSGARVFIKRDGKSKALGPFRHDTHELSITLDVTLK